jgi:hypothetical protein
MGHSVLEAWHAIALRSTARRLPQRRRGNATAVKAERDVSPVQQSRAG